MSCGNQFVDRLRKLGYVNAAKLNGEDFDWLFENTDTKSFLEWFCVNVSEQNVLSEDTLNAFNSLKESGKFILDENDLHEVLKTCKSAESRGTSQEEVELEKLEEEFQSLQKLKNLKLNRRNKLQVMASSNSHMSLKLKDEEEGAAKKLKKAQEALSAENAKINNELKTLIEGVKMLISFFNASNVDPGSGPQAVLLSQLAIENYLYQEELSTAALTSYTKKQFFEGISELIDSSNEENFELLQLDVSKSSICDESSEVYEERRREMARLQFAYICARQQMVQLKANDAGLKAGLQRAEEYLCSVQNKTSGKENLEVRISSLKHELVNIESQVKQMNNETIPDLVKENAQLLNMPIVKSDFDLQIARQDYYTSRQDLICSQLVKQKASFELLQLAYEIELQKHRHVHRQLEALIQELKQNSKALDHRLEMLSKPAISQFAKPKNSIDSKDVTSHRIYQLVEGKNKKQQLFKTYEVLEQVAQKLMHTTTSLQDQLVASHQEQSLIISKMDADIETLCESMYYGGGYLLLSTQELFEQFQQLESQLNSLNQLVMDIIGDVKNKKKLLETNKLHTVEKQLYVYFFQDDDRLKEIVEQLETQANIQRTT